MSKSRRYADLAQCFARLAAQAATAVERADYHSAAAAYLQLAKNAASAELGPAPAVMALD